ncbi:MAG TPA: acyltransferase [Geminicoccaceae bacterium]|nr:acyltransferase [Geminicoccus sp.]HMU49750.1 acyltransferase [Geminicoccaceae bacterium]
MSGREDRLTSLDGLRGLAALAVVGYHYTTDFVEDYAPPDWVGIDLAYGRFGVTLFFIISGFVITMTLEHTRSAGDYLVSRFARLYPAYWIAVLVTFVVVTALGLPNWQRSVPDLLVNLTMLQSFVGRPDIDQVYWTLAFELTFYVLMLGIWLSPLRSRLVPVLWAWLAIVLLYEWLEPELPTLAARVWRKLMVLKFAHLFIAGIALRQIHLHGPSWSRLALLAACVAAQALHPELAPMWTTAALLGLVALAVAGWLPALSWRPLLFLGTISYTLYLAHQHMGYAVLLRLWHAGVPPEAAVLLTMAAAVAMAFAYTRLVERPALRFIRERWAQHRESRKSDRDVLSAPAPRPG